MHPPRYTLTRARIPSRKRLEVPRGWLIIRANEGTAKKSQPQKNATLRREKNPRQFWEKTFTSPDQGAVSILEKRAARFLRGWLDHRRQESALNKH